MWYLIFKREFNVIIISTKRFFFSFLISVLFFNELYAQRSDSALTKDTQYLEEFCFINSKNNGFIRNGIKSDLVSFKIQLPKQRTEVCLNKLQFVFLFSDSVYVLIETRPFEVDSIINGTERIEMLKAYEIQWRFLDCYDNYNKGYLILNISEDRIHYLIRKRGNIIVLLNVKPENLDFYLASANSFTEIIP